MNDAFKFTSSSSSSLSSNPALAHDIPTGLHSSPKQVGILPAVKTLYRAGSISSRLTNFVMKLGVTENQLERMEQFVRFCLVGLSGTAVDMGMLFVFADSRMLAWNVSTSKLCAAEIALLNNFMWNELWTFRSHDEDQGRHIGALRRLAVFNAVCGAGILLAVLFINIFHKALGWNLYLSNGVSVALVTMWNFGLNAKFNWRSKASNS
jgi:putative flippase GtrA